MILPKNINHIVVHCGSNNLQHSSPEDIASAIILIGVTLTERCSNVKVLITGILPRGYQWTNLRSKIHKTNYFIKMFTARYDNLFFFRKFAKLDFRKWKLKQKFFLQRFYPSY